MKGTEERESDALSFSTHKVLCKEFSPLKKSVGWGGGAYERLQEWSREYRVVREQNNSFCS